MIAIDELVSDWPRSPFGSLAREPWAATQSAASLIEGALDRLGDGFVVSNGVALHRFATVEAAAIVKAPAIIGEGAFVAATAYLRGGVFLDSGCSVGPACEVKSSFLFAGAALAHLSFVGDSILGARVNVEAGAIIANHRNEKADKRIRFLWRGAVVDTGVEKFGALIGDDARIGANAVIAPGAALEAGAQVDRLSLVDQDPDAGA